MAPKGKTIPAEGRELVFSIPAPFAQSRNHAVENKGCGSRQAVRRGQGRRCHRAGSLFSGIQQTAPGKRASARAPPPHDPSPGILDRARPRRPRHLPEPHASGQLSAAAASEPACEVFNRRRARRRAHPWVAGRARGRARPRRHQRLPEPRSTRLVKALLPTWPRPAASRLVEVLAMASAPGRPCARGPRPGPPAAIARSRPPGGKTAPQTGAGPLRMR
jgi:hypothetical protein